MAANPVLVEVARGPLVESRHRGAVAIASDDGRLVLSLGDVAGAVFPRSAVKAIQALPLVESGAAEAVNLGDAEIALACASHNGEPEHVSTARHMLARIGLDERALACGPHLPRRDEDRDALARAGEAPSRLHNNCSGKHAGMLIAARHLGLAPAGYERPDHPLQQMIREAMETLFDVPLTPDVCGIDGCSLPTWAAPLASFASTFARIGTGAGLGPERAAAFARIRRAAAGRPEMVAGTGRFCTRVMEAFGGRLFVKTGAEGVFCASLPELRLGVSLKIDDGATRASEVVMAEILLRLLGDKAERECDLLHALAHAPVRNWAGSAVGEIRPTVELSAALKDLAGRA